MHATTNKCKDWPRTARNDHLLGIRDLGLATVEQPVPKVPSGCRCEYLLQHAFKMYRVNYTESCIDLGSVTSEDQYHI